MKRILLFLVTNIAVIAVASIVLNLLGIDGYLQRSGSGLNLTSLLIFCAVFGFVGSFISLFLSKTIAKWSTGVKLITQPSTQDEIWLLQTVRELSQKAGIGMPEVGIFPAQQSNAFATGWNRNNALVAVSQGLLSRFGRNEARAVIGHEIGHVANGDMVTLTLIQGVINTFVMFLARVVAYAIDSFLRRDEDGEGLGGIAYFVTVIVCEIVFGIAASTIVMWFSRWREYHADAAGAKLAGREHMIAALECLKAEQGMPNQLPESMTAFGINEGTRKSMARFFSSHPPLDDRIRALRESTSIG